MELKDVLGRVPGLHRRFVYYLEAQGHIRPVRIQKSRISRRDYSEEDLRVVSAVWRYNQRGYGVQAAYDLVANRPPTTAYVSVTAPPRRWVGAIRRLQLCPDVVEISGVYAPSTDLFIKTRTPEEADIYHTVLPILAEAGGGGTPTVMVAGEGFQGTAAGSGGAGKSMLAYVLMTVPGKDVQAVMDELRAIPEVAEASTVYGESDIVIKVRAPDQDALDTLVMDRLHGISQVMSTRTFIVVSKFHWSREQS